VVTSAVDINSIIDLALVYGLLTKDLLGGSVEITHPAEGDWILPQALTYYSGPSHLLLENLAFTGLDSIYELTFERFPQAPYDLGFQLMMGNGTMNNGSVLPNVPFKAPPFVFEVEVDVTVILDTTTTQSTIADNAFRVALGFGEVNISSIQEILFNLTTFNAMSLTQIGSPRCYLAVIDKVTLESFYTHIGEFIVTIPLTCTGTNEPAGCFGRNPSDCSGNICNLGAAMDQLRIEAGVTDEYVAPQESRPLTMLNVILSNIGSSVVDTFNGLNLWNQTLANCQVPTLVFTILSGVNNATDAANLVTALLKNVTDILTYPPPRVSADYSTVTVQSYRVASSTSAFETDVVNAALLADPVVNLEIGSICDTLNLPFFLMPICNTFLGNGPNLTTVINDWTAPQLNLIDALVDPYEIESRVEIDWNTDPFYDIRTSSIVSLVNNFVAGKASDVNGYLASIANTTGFLFVEADGSVSLKFNMTELLYELDKLYVSPSSCSDGTGYSSYSLTSFLGVSNAIIPGLRLLPGNFEITNFGELTSLILLKPYTVNGTEARVTTEQEFGWQNADSPLGVSLGFDLFYDQAFVNGGPIPSGIEAVESVNMTMTLEGFLVQILFLLATDTKALGEISLGDFLTVDQYQAFHTNCLAGKCLFSGVYYGGLYIPQFSVSAKTIVGPSFTASGNLFSKGVVMFVNAVLEILVQLFQENLENLTQGPLRTYINNILVAYLKDAKTSNACELRRNYTETYPLGADYCAYNGSAKTIVQNEEECISKGHICQWAPPDAQLTATTICCKYSEEAQDLNFQTAVGLQQLKSFVDGSLMNPDSPFYLRSFFETVVDPAVGGTASFGPYPLAYNGDTYGDIAFTIGSFHVQGLGNISSIQIFDPSPYSQNGSAHFKNNAEYEPESRRRRLDDDLPNELSTELARDLVDLSQFQYSDNKYTTRTAVFWNAPINFTFELSYTVTGLFTESPSVVNNIVTELSFSQFYVGIDLFMLVNIPRLMDLEVQSINTLQQLPCILRIFEDNGLIPVNLNITFWNANFLFDCKECQSPLFAPLTYGSGFSSAASKPLSTVFTSTLNGVVNFLVQALASSSAQDFLNSQIAIANSQCQDLLAGIAIPTVAPQNSANAATAMGIAGLSSLFAAFCGCAMLVPIHFRRRDELMKRALLDAHERGAAGKSKDEFELAERRLSSAFEHPMIPKIVKYGAVFWVVVNVIFFATANFAAAGAIVEITVGLAGDSTYPITIMDFTLASSINQMWDAGVYALAIIIALASGAWPYTKQLLLLFSWFAPTTVLHPAARGRLLEILDALGKWSLIDFYVLIMLMVGFKFYITSTMVSSLSLLPPDVLVLDVTVVPGWGIFGFVLAVMGSLFLNHTMTYWHRKIIRADEDLQDAILGTLVKDLRTPRIPLSRHRFNILDAEGRPYRYSVTVRISLIAAFVFSFFMIIIGAVVPSIVFQFEGLGGLALELIDSGLAQQTYSVASIGVSLINGSDGSAGSTIGIIFLQILFMLFSLILPLLLCILMVVIWVVPLTLREQLLLYFAAEILSAWETLLVLVLSLIGAVLQISQLAQFIVNYASGNLCTLIQQELQSYFPNPSDAMCFNVIASLVPTSAIIICAAVAMLVSCAVGFRLMHAAIEDRELAMRRKPPHSPGDMNGLAGFLIRRCLEAFGASQIPAGGSVANLFAQGQGAFDSRKSNMTVSNPIMARELQPSLSLQTPNPMYRNGASSNNTSRSAAHASIDV